VAMLAMHGGAYLAAKADEPVASRARSAASVAAVALVALFFAGGIWTATGLDGYRLVGSFAHDLPSNPLNKQVARFAGAWLVNYAAAPVLWLVPATAIACAALAIGALRRTHDNFAVFLTGLSVACVVATAGVSMFPFILPSDLAPAMSLTVWDASSSRSTLLLMLVATVLFMPIILVYTAFVYRVLRGRVSAKQLETDSHSY
jgi:cytochrome bd ubiquinol oxidase subunit II